MAIGQVTSSATQSLSATTDTLVNSMTLTPDGSDITAQIAATGFFRAS